MSLTWLKTLLTICVASAVVVGCGPQGLPRRSAGLPAKISRAAERTKSLQPALLMWNWCGIGPIAFEIWHSPDLSAWGLYATVTNILSCEVWPANEKEFFIVRSLDPSTGLNSDWARTGVNPCQ